MLTLWDIMEKYYRAYAAEFVKWTVQIQMVSAHIEHTKLRGGTLKEWLQHMIRDACDGLLRLARLFPLPVTTDICESILLVSEGPFDPLIIELMKPKLDAILNAADVELKSVKFIHASNDMVAYLDKTNPFGKFVAKAFPECSEDIAESHECFAFARYTASMFHLGRAMEISVKRTAKKMGVTSRRDEWQAYLSAMQEHINKMPYGKPIDKAKRAVWSEVSGHFFNFKEAWRNPTFHAKKTYTREESLSVLTNAGVFMDFVSRKVFKVKTA